MNVIVSTNSSSKEIDVVNRFFIFRLFLFFYRLFFVLFWRTPFAMATLYLFYVVLLLFVDMTTETLSLSIFNLERKVLTLLLLLRYLHIILGFFPKCTLISSLTFLIKHTAIY